MNINDAVKVASVLKATAISQLISQPEQERQYAELKQKFHDALDDGTRVLMHCDSLEWARYKTLEEIQTRVRGIVSNFAYQYIRDLVNGARLEISEEEMFSVIDPTLVTPIRDIKTELQSNIEVSANDYKRFCDQWLALDFNDVVKALDERFGGDYAARLLNEQVAVKLSRELGFAYSHAVNGFSDYKAGKKLERSFYSRKNEWSHTPNFARELDYGHERTLHELSEGFRHAAATMNCEDLNDTANAIKTLMYQVQRQRGYFDSRTKSEFGTSTMTLFNEKFVLTMTKSAANKLIIFLRKYAGSEFKGNEMRQAA